jgi:hypothetical protein
MGSFTFWQKWLFIVSLIFALFGFFMAFFNQTLPFDFLFNNQINPVFWRSVQIPIQALNFQQWIYGVLGATCVLVGIFLLYLIHYPFHKREIWVWKCISFGFTLWFFIDTSISLYSGVIFNAVFNVLLYVVFIGPMLMCRKYFK